MSETTESEDNMLITFLVGHTEEKVTENKFLLSSQSEVFERMIYGELKEKEPIKIPDIEIDAFQTMLKFLKNKQVSFSNIDHASRVFYAADKYILPALKSECANYIYPCTIDDIWTALDCGTLYNNKSLKEAALKLVRQNTYQVLKSKQFLTLSRPALKAIAQEDFLDITSEVELFNAIMSWTKHQCFQKGKSYGCKNYREELGNVIQDIRFLTMTQGEMIEYGKLVLTSDEINMLVGYLKKESDLKLVGLSCNINKRKKVEIKLPTQAVIHTVKFNKGQEKQIVLSRDIKNQKFIPAFTSDFYLYSIIIPSRNFLNEDSDRMYFERVVVYLNDSGGAFIASGSFRGRVEYDSEIRIPLFTQDGNFPNLLAHENGYYTSYYLKIYFQTQVICYYPLMMCHFKSVFPCMEDTFSYVIGIEYSS